MGSKRRFKDEIDSINQNGSNVNKKILSDNEYLNNLKDNEFNKETTQSNINLIVKELVNELIECTDNNLNNEFIASINNIATINKSTTTNHFINNELDDLLKIDFNLINQDALLNQQFDTTANFNETTTIIEHNYANVPSTSNNNLFLNNQSNKAIKGVLKINNDHQIKNKKNVKFKGVTVFYFSRSQGGSSVPSQGYGSSLGMDIKHCDLKNFTLDAHQEEKRQVHREILLRQKRYEKSYRKQQLKSKQLQSNQSDSDDDSLDNISDISDSELELDSWYFLQPVPVKQRRALLRESGVVKIDSSEKEQCREIRFSREYCGCNCKIYCDPDSCECSLNGIKCQVDRSTFPCGCSKDCCGNLNGRIEFNPVRVRKHFNYTLMRLGLERKNENQQYNDENLDHHQNNLYMPLSSNNHLTNQDNQYELKYTTNSIQQSNDIYNSLESNNLNILNCNETNLTANDSHGDLFEYMDSSSSCYSECTDGLDCTLTNDNQTLNGLHLSPFSLLNTSSSTNVIPSTNNELINNQLNYDNNYSQNFLTDQSFRYYSSNFNNLNGTQPQQIDHNNLQNLTTNNDQLINNLNYQTYYSDHLYNSNNLTSVIDCYSQPNNFNKTSITNDLQPQQLHLNTNNFNNNELQSQFEINHYTDLSQSIASSTKSSAESIIYNNLLTNSSATNLCPELLDNSCLNNSSNDFQDLDCQINSNMNSDDSTSRQSLTNLDNYLSNGSNESPIGDDEDNFGRIIVESVTA